jgi:hypothetical protein
LLAILNILQSSQRATTHIYTVKIINNTLNPSIIESSFGSYNREYIMDGEKKNHTYGKMLKCRVGRAFFLPRAWKCGASQPRKKKMKQWNNARVAGDRESME